MREIEAQAKALAPVIARLVARNVEQATRAIADQVEAKCREMDALLQQLRESVPAQISVDDVARAAAALVPTPKGGVSVDPESVRLMVQEAVEALPPAKDGKDADPEQIAAAVREAVSAIPAPKDGTSVTMADVQPLIDEALRGLRASADDVFADTLAQAQQLRDGLAKSITELRQPEDGRSFTAEDAAPIIERAVAEIASRADERIGKAVEAAEDAARVAAEKAGSLRQPEDGRSITVEDVRPLIEEAIQREVAAIPHPEDGKSVTLEQLQPVVAEAVKSAVGAIQVPAPRHGEDGRDAVQLEILPAIDEGKSYPRGSYAKHAGGLWRAYETTHGMRGWECIVEGIAEHRVEQIDERSFEAVSVLSGGQEVRKAISVPALIDRGVFRADAKYKAGDGVTWGGSYWIAKDESPSGKPGEPGSEGWRLAVKRGRDGKDGKNGVDKTAPVRISE